MLSGGYSNSTGGLIGSAYSSDINNSFWDTETSGQTNSDGGIGKATSEMIDVATFTNLTTTGLDAPWDFVGDPFDDNATEDYWNIDASFNNGYPYLSWQSTINLTDSLVAYYNFDDSTATDVTGNGHNGTVNGSVPMQMMKATITIMELLQGQL